MKPTTVMALFCEDIREEKNGVVTLVGIMPDNVNVTLPEPDQSGVTTLDADARVVLKLCIYIRINFDPEFDLPEPVLRMIAPDGDVIPLGTIDAGTIKKARTEAKAKGNLMAGIISRIVVGGFKFPRRGSLRLEVALGTETHLAAALNFQVAPTASSSATN